MNARPSVGRVVTLVVELQLEGINEVRERHQAVSGVVHQNHPAERENHKKFTSFQQLTQTNKF